MDMCAGTNTVFARVVAGVGAALGSSASQSPRQSHEIARAQQAGHLTDDPRSASREMCWC
jgi:hypothetical protein